MYQIVAESSFQTAGFAAVGALSSLVALSFSQTLNNFKPSVGPDLPAQLGVVQSTCRLRNSSGMGEPSPSLSNWSYLLPELGFPRETSHPRISFSLNRLRGVMILQP